MRVLCFGGRDWRNQVRMNAELDRLHAVLDFDVLINGGQVSRDRTKDELFGADWQAAVWAQSRGVPVTYFYANWNGEGKAAGMIRNKRMLHEGHPDLGVEFPGGPGTKNMHGLLIVGRIPIVVVTPKVLNRHRLIAGPLPPEAIYIGRGTKWGNPFKIDEDCTREQAIRYFRHWVGEVTQMQLIADARRELRGFDLVCSCKPQACHGDMWLKIANSDGPISP
jgi:hypothetical protein